MKHLIQLLILLLVYGCQKPQTKHMALGTWNKCHHDGEYSEYKITNDYFMLLTTRSEHIFIFRNQLTDKGIILSEFKNGDHLLINNDTLITVSQSDSKVVLKSTYTYDNYEFYKTEFKIDAIDSLDIESWETKILAEFKKRAKAMACSDLRTDEEKTSPIINLDDLKEEDLKIKEVEQ